MLSQYSRFTVENLNVFCILSLKTLFTGRIANIISIKLILGMTCKFHQSNCIIDIVSFIDCLDSFTLFTPYKMSSIDIGRIWSCTISLKGQITSQI